MLKHLRRKKLLSHLHLALVALTFMYSMRKSSVWYLGLSLSSSEALIGSWPSACSITENFFSKTSQKSHRRRPRGPYALRCLTGLKNGVGTTTSKRTPASVFAPCILAAVPVPISAQIHNTSRARLTRLDLEHSSAAARLRSNPSVCGTATKLALMYLQTHQDRDLTGVYVPVAQESFFVGEGYEVTGSTRISS